MKSTTGAVAGGLACLSFALAVPQSHTQGLDGRDYAVELTAQVAADPPRIDLIWPADTNALSYTIRRKLRDETVWHDLPSLDGSASQLVDQNVQTGVGYEYQVIKDSSLGIKAYGYIYSGLNLPLVEDRGTVIIVTEENLASALAPELRRLEFDWIGEGWKVESTTISSTNSPPELKAKIQAIYARDPIHTRALLLFGHVPVAYSGNIMPDGHPNHLGSWPADVYYADLDGAWTDDTVNSTSGESPRQWNIPGDGKFDQSEPPSPIELQTGRVDLSRLTCFENKTPSRSELDLARQYLDKNHRFRIGNFPVNQRGIVFDRIESITAEPISAMSWRNLVPLVGRDVRKIWDDEYFPTVSSGTYLWSAVTAGGGYTSSDRVGTSDAFALNNVNVVFTTFLGSYYGDWDVESSFLRAPLGASGTLLCNVYSGQPQWIFHHMGLGEPIGFSTRITQENNETGLYPPHNNGAGQVHVALMGDPTLRAYPIPSLVNLKGAPSGNGLDLAWQVPQMNGFVGSLVYTAPAAEGPYRRATPEPIPGNSFHLENYQPSDWVMVRAVALTETPSGTFYNASVGAFYPDPLNEIAAHPPAAPTALSISRSTAETMTLSWVGVSVGTLGFRVERKEPAGSGDFHEIGEVSGETFTFQDRFLPAPGLYTYRVRAFNSAGNSDYSVEATGSTLVATAEFVGTDLFTQGTWIGAYGQDGVVIPGFIQTVPAFCSMVTSNLILYQTQLRDDPRAMQLTNSIYRSANCWVCGTPGALHFNFDDDQVHQVSLFLDDWSQRHSVADVEVLDAVSGASLDHRTFDNIDNGAYIIYNLRRQVSVRLTPSSIYTNTEVYGVFFDKAHVAPVQFQPAAGAFFGHTQVTLETPTAGTQIFYTTDGSEPTTDSPRYDGPFALLSSTEVKARAFRDGFEPSPVAQARYDNSLVTLALVSSWDGDTGGNWPTKYGSEGFWLPLSEPSLPQFIECSLSGAAPWIWNDQASETQAPLASKNGDLRQARAWYADSSLTLNVGVYDSKMHALSLYFLDYDNVARIQGIEITRNDGSLVDRLTVDSFAHGRYLTLAVEGQIQIRISRVQGPNAVLSGIFVDPGPSILSLVKPAPLSNLTVNAGAIRFTVDAFSGLHIYTDRSSNLVDWACISTNLISSSPAQITVPIDPFEAKQFFRTHIAP